ncbi:MAG: PKD domain-containing protein, partial [Deltaproteobacteria bacterium]|nr:PKD domain-containing protein [Deltaproteobacteria bacterium]
MARAWFPRLMRPIAAALLVVLVSGCDFWGFDDLTASITSPSGNVTILAGQSLDFESTVYNGDSPYTYQWDFGGGATGSSLENPGPTTFNTAGSFAVTLTVTDSSGDTASDSITVVVEPAWEQASAGEAHSVALKSDRTLWAWGYNGNGELGDGTYLARTAPVQVGSDTDWTAVAAGGHHTLALKQDGT